MHQIDVTMPTVLSLSFESPWMLLGLLVLAAAVLLWWWADRRRMRYTLRFTNLDVLAAVVSGRPWARYVPAGLLVLGLAALVVASARPEVERTFLAERATVILVVDTSRSMQARDVAPSRLAAAQEALHTFLREAPDDLRVGLIVFAGEAQVATPPTTDHELVEAAVVGIDGYLVTGGTAIGDALRTAVLLGRQVTDLVPEDGSAAARGPVPPRALAQSSPGDDDDGSEPSTSPVSILFLSDGAQTRGLLQPLEGAKLAREAGFPVYTIALGTPDGVIERGSFGGIPGSQDSSQLIPVPPDPRTLRSISEMTGGEFSEARDAGTLTRAYENLGSRLGREERRSEITWLFVAIAGALLLLAAGAAAVVSPRFP